MCDFRNIIGVIIDGEEIPAQVQYGEADFSFQPPKPDIPGLYCIGATGCGLYYWSGKAWYADYYEEDTQYIKACKYVVDGYRPMLMDVWDYEKEN